METIKSASESVVATSQNLIRSASELFRPEVILENSYLFAVLSIFLAVYGPRLHIRLPASIRSLFSNVFFRAFVIFIVVYLSNRSMGASLVIVIIFMVTMNLLQMVDTIQTTVSENFVVVPPSTEGKPVASCDLYQNQTTYPLHETTPSGELSGFNEGSLELQFARPQ